MYTSGKLSAPGSQKSSHFLCRVIWRDAMDQNKLDPLQLVWAVTCEQMKIKSKFFPLGTWYYMLMWLEAQSPVKKKVFINFFNAHTFFAYFSKNRLFKNCSSCRIDVNPLYTLHRDPISSPKTLTKMRTKYWASFKKLFWVSGINWIHICLTSSNT